MLLTGVEGTVAVREGQWWQLGRSGHVTVEVCDQRDLVSGNF